MNNPLPSELREKVVSELLQYKAELSQGLNHWLLAELPQRFRPIQSCNSSSKNTYVVAKQLSQRSTTRSDIQLAVAKVRSCTLITKLSTNTNIT